MRYALRNGAVQDPEINLALTYFIMGKAFGYTPQEVDIIDATLVEHMVEMYSELKKLENGGKK